MDEQRARSTEGAAAIAAVEKATTVTETVAAGPAILTASVVAALPVANVVSVLAGRASGLSEAEAASRLQRFGPNTITARPRTPLLPRLLANFTHLMALLLWFGGAIALVGRLPQLAVAIWSVNLINGCFSFWQEYKAEKATEALRRLLPSYARVVRDSREAQILAEELVPGDVVLLQEGEHVSADARLVEASDLRVDQSTLTGESLPALKRAAPVAESGAARAELPNVVFAGTSVVAGAGRAVVFATGMSTEFGTIARLTQGLGEAQSPLQIELARATRWVTAISVGVGVVFFVLAAVLVGVDLTESGIFAIGMIVAFIPEGMLPTVTLSLAVGVQRMASRNALIKRLSAVETLGCTSVICTDKTGTLTQNEMTVRNLWVPGRTLTVTGAGYAPEGEIRDGSEERMASTDPELALLLTAAALCTDARMVAPQEGLGGWTVLGDPTEGALLRVAVKAGIDLDAVATALPRVRELPFESQRRRMSTIHRGAEGLVAFTKGSPRELLGLSVRMRVGDEERSLTDALRAEAIAANDDFARAGLRVLGVALRPLAPGQDLNDAAEVERDLTFVGLVAMMDPPRPEVEAAVETCHRAGIRVVMVTGDYGLTAEGIARRVGILRGGRPRTLTGPEIDGLDDTALQTALNEEVIVARATPEHKLRVVAALQAAGHVVAVTGDGVNDAPALKKADIGIAMGLSGTDVAREAADMVLTDDNFASIVNAVEEGRAVFANIKKFLSYIFTSNTAEAFPFVFYVFSGGRIPLALTIMEVLSIDLGTDMLPALALGVEPPEPGVMDRPPRPRSEHVITRSVVLRGYGLLGTVAGVAAMAVFFAHYWIEGFAGRWLDLPDTGAIHGMATSMFLAAVVAAQVGNVFAHRTDRASAFRVNPFGNRIVLIAVAVEIAFLGVIVYVPALQWVFGTGPIRPMEWVLLLPVVPLLLLTDELRKAVLRRRDRRREGGMS